MSWLWFRHPSGAHYNCWNLVPFGGAARQRVSDARQSLKDARTAELQQGQPLRRWRTEAWVFRMLLHTQCQIHRRCPMHPYVNQTRRMAVLPLVVGRSRESSEPSGMSIQALRMDGRCGLEVLVGMWRGVDAPLGWLPAHCYRLQVAPTRSSTCSLRHSASR